MASFCIVANKAHGVSRFRVALALLWHLEYEVRKGRPGNDLEVEYSMRQRRCGCQTGAVKSTKVGSIGTPDWQRAVF